MIRCVTCVCENVEGMFVLVIIKDTLFFTNGIYYVAKFSYKSRSILLRHRMNVWKGVCVGKMCLLIQQLRKEPMLYQ